MSNEAVGRAVVGESQQGFEPTQGAAGTNDGNRDRLGVVDLLRCIAGTSVLWLHLTGASRNSAFESTGNLGWVGVEIFFVVSGFVIPYAMQRGSYRLPGDTSRFIVRRLVRLDPPYFIASAFAALLAYAAWKTPNFQGPPPAISWEASIAHVGYLNGILGLPWYNPACWTLGIEFQFYLLAAILFPVFAGKASRFLPLAVGALACALLAAQSGRIGEQWFLCWSPLFIMGISAFRARAGIAGRLELLATQTLALGVAIAIGRWQGAVAAALSVAVITFMHCNLPRLVAAYAAITYSLYLVHIPIGCRVVHLVERMGSGVAIDGLAIILGLATSVLAANVFWKYVESPSLRWSARIRPDKMRL